MAKASGSIDLRPMKDASKVADNFLKFEPNKGLMVADQTNGIQAIDTTTQRNVLIDADSVDVRDGQNVLASFGTSTIVGKPNAENVSISSSGIEIHNTYIPYGNSGTYLGVYGPVASFTADSHRLGGPKQGHLTVTNKGLSVFSGDENSKYNEVANFFTRQKKFEYDNYEDEFQFDWKTGTKLNIRFETTKDANIITDPVISCCVEWEEDGDIISTGFTEFSAVLSSLTVDGSTYNFSKAISSVGNEAIVSITSLQNLSLGNDAKFLIKIKYTARVQGPHYGLGYLVQPIGTFSTALGQGTISLGDYQLALGNYNKPNKDALFVIGNGTADDDRSNAFTIDRNGNILIDSNSIDIRSEETQTVLTTIDGDGLRIYDASSAANPVANFLSTGSQIGRSGEQHAIITSSAFTLVSDDDVELFSVSSSGTPKSQTVTHTSKAECRPPKRSLVVDLEQTPSSGTTISVLGMVEGGVKGNSGVPVLMQEVTFVAGTSETKTIYRLPTGSGSTTQYGTCAYNGDKRFTFTMTYSQQETMWVGSRITYTVVTVTDAGALKVAGEHYMNISADTDLKDAIHKFFWESEVMVDA